MRILHVIAGNKQAGADPLMLAAVLALADAGLEQTAVLRESDEAARAALSDAGMTCKRAAFDKNWREPTKAVIRAAAGKQRPDVIQYWLGRSAMFAPKSLRAGAVGWHGGFHNLTRFKNCDWHMAASQPIAAHVLDSGLAPERVAVITPFADAVTAAPADRAALATPDSAEVVFAIAPDGKAADTLFAAAARLPEVYFWVAAGPGEEAALREAAKAAEVADRTRIIARAKDRAGVLAACDAVAIAGPLAPFDPAAAEAWAAGRPLVAVEAALPAAGAADEVDALIIPKADSKALAERIARVLEDAELARRLADNGQRAYETHYTRTAFVRATMAFYERVRQSAAAAERKPAA